MSEIFGGPSQTTTASTEPWSVQQPFLTTGFNNAQSVYDQRAAAGPYTGSLYSPVTPEQLNTANAANQWGNTWGQNLTNNTALTAQNLQGASSPFVANATALAANPYGAAGIPAGYQNALGQAMSTAGNLAANPTISAPSALTAALNNQALGTSGLSGALNANALQATHGLGATQNSLMNAIQTAETNPTQGIIQNATAYASNPYVQDALNSTNQTIDQTLNEQTLPGVNRAAAMGGVLNSSRAGAANAQAQEGAAIAKGQADSSILNNAYNSGLSTASTQQLGNLNAAISGSSLGYNDLSNAANTTAGQQQNATTAGLASNLGYQEAFGNQILNANNQLASTASNGANTNLGYLNSAVAQQLGANAQLGQAANAGLLGAADTGALNNTNFTTSENAAALPYQDANLADQAALQSWQLQNTYPQSILSDYMKDVGGNYGGTSTSTTDQSNSILGNLLGLGLGGAALFGSGGAFPGVGSAIGNLFGGGGAANTALGGASAVGNALAFR